MTQLKGIGEILKDGQPIATVIYAFEQLRASEHAQLVTTGTLKVLQGEYLRKDVDMRDLRLEDGVQCSFWVDNLVNPSAAGTLHAIYFVNVNLPPNA